MKCFDYGHWLRVTVKTCNGTARFKNVNHCLSINISLA